MKLTDAVVLITFGIAIPGAILASMVRRIGRKRKSSPKMPLTPDEAIIIRLHGSSIGEQFKTGAEYLHFIGGLQWAMGNVGQVRGEEAADGAITITLLGESADQMYRRIRRVIRHASISENASVILRYGPPGSVERRTHMAN